MFTYTYSGEPLFCSAFRGDFRLFATWRSDSALGSESSKNARQWHFIRAEGSSNGSWRSRRAHPAHPAGVVASQPNFTIRRALVVLGFCTRYFDRGFFVWCFTLVPRRLWFRYWERGIWMLELTFAAVYFPSSFSLCSSSSSPALRAQTRPAIEFGSGEEGLRPRFHSPFSFLSSFSSWSTDKGLGVFLWFQPLPLSPLLFGRGVRGHRRLDLF